MYREHVSPWCYSHYHLPTQALTATQSDSQIFKKFRQLCGRTGLLPASHMILGSLIKTRDHPIASGAFGDVWEGIYAGNRVAIKSLRVYRDDDVRKARKLFCKEVVMWRKISHPNIVPLLGVSEAPAPISMVSEWMPNGDVRSYVEKNPEVSRLQLLLDISRGLSFLHSHEIVHGDLKGANILVDKSGRARINDFGLTIIASLNCTETSASSGGTYRWMAPELLGLEQNPNKRCLPTPQSDAFALGMVAIEVFTGQVPFPELTRPFAVTKKLVDGERPPRPPKASKLGLSNELWAAVQSLWAQEPGDRPPLDTFVDLLERVNPDMGLLEELKEFDANSDEHIAKLDYMLQYGDNALFGMREDESLVLIELFDRVGLHSTPSPPCSDMPRF
ncbi:kinase-like domain-containing protein [Thelephora terrestris]|uniref:Kinase-like domain-containing protein n=1 Tax=Thelephora terrestris TaxID=56493 RepID=A0A9P6LAD9_9AGAM|nr:kinase-like domain-containing protein [Thelephora terrestris]